MDELQGLSKHLCIATNKYICMYGLNIVHLNQSLGVGSRGAPGALFLYCHSI